MKYDGCGCVWRLVYDTHKTPKRGGVEYKRVGQPCPDHRPSTLPPIDTGRQQAAPQVGNRVAGGNMDPLL